MATPTASATQTKGTAQATNGGQAAGTAQGMAQGPAGTAASQAEAKVCSVFFYTGIIEYMLMHDRAAPSPHRQRAGYVLCFSTPAFLNVMFLH